MFTTSFHAIRRLLPKMKQRNTPFETPKIAFVAKTEQEIVFKLDSKTVFLLSEDGTYTVCSHAELVGVLRERSSNANHNVTEESYYAS